MAAVSRQSIPDSLPLEQPPTKTQPLQPTSQPLSPAEPSPTTVRSSVSDHDRSPDQASSPAPPPPPFSRHHSASPSTTSLPRGPQRSPSGILSFAAAAFDKTQSRLANISDPTVRPRHSLARLSLAPGSLPSSEPSSPNRKSLFRSSSNQSLSSIQAAEAKVPLSQPYSETDPNTPPPIKVSPRDNKMHQTSSRLLRMTDDERPFTKVCTTPLASLQRL